MHQELYCVDDRLGGSSGGGDELVLRIDNYSFAGASVGRCEPMLIADVQHDGGGMRLGGNGNSRCSSEAFEAALLGLNGQAFSLLCIPIFSPERTVEEEAAIEAAEAALADADAASFQHGRRFEGISESFKRLRGQGKKAGFVNVEEPDEDEGPRGLWRSQGLAQEQERHEQERQEKKSKKRRCLGCLQLLNKLEAPSAEAALLPSAEGQAFKPAGFSAKDIRTAASFLAALGETVELSMKAELVRRVAEKQAQQQKSKQRFRAAGKAAAFAVAGGKRSSKQGRHRSS